MIIDYVNVNVFEEGEVIEEDFCCKEFEEMVELLVDYVKVCYNEKEE